MRGGMARRTVDAVQASPLRSDGRARGTARLQLRSKTPMTAPALTLREELRRLVVEENSGHYGCSSECHKDASERVALAFARRVVEEAAKQHCGLCRAGHALMEGGGFHFGVAGRCEAFKLRRLLASLSDTRETDQGEGGA